MKLSFKKSISLVLVAVSFLSLAGVAHAIDAADVPQVNLNQTPTKADEPFGAFKIVQCDGPEALGHVGADGRIDLSKDASGNYNTPLKQGYIPCNFKGLMIQMQFLINAAIVIGVVAAMLGFAYAGFLYITGTQKNLALAKSIFPKVAIGFIIMLAAWFIVYQILRWLTGPTSGYLQ